MSNKLVAYFSAGGTTAGIAEKLAKVTEADLFRDQAEDQIYGSADLDWNNPKSRSSLEMSELNDRPLRR